MTGSLGKTPGGGRIPTVDKDGDGKVDDVTVFCKVEHPRSVYRAARSGSYAALSVFHDDDGDGVADRRRARHRPDHRSNQSRGGDHTTNGIRMGIDGWIYIGVGDYGIKRPKPRTAARSSCGNGIVRVR